MKINDFQIRIFLLSLVSLSGKKAHFLKKKKKESAGKKEKYLFRRNVLLFKLFLPLGNHAVLCAPDRIFPFMPLFCGKTDFFFIDFNSKPRSG